MPTLLLSERQSEDAQLLWRAGIAAKWDVVRVHGWKVPPLSTRDIAVYGEPLFTRHVAQTLGLRLVEPPLDWLPKLPAKWRGRDVRLTTLAEARKITTRAFVKPADEKCFDARVYWSGAELPHLGVLPGDMPVLVQAIVEWKLEFRCFVLDQKVLTLSPYWRDGQSAKTGDGTWIATSEEVEAAKRFCESVLVDNSVEIPDAIVVDVGIMADFGWAVIESNAAFSSGIYGCDAEQVLAVLRRAAHPIENTQRIVRRT